MIFAKANILYILLFAVFVFRFASVCEFGVTYCQHRARLYTYRSRELIPPVLVSLRNSFARNIGEYMKSPYKELLLGYLLGLNDIKTLSRYNDMLIQTGTIHVVVVSGFNISLVCGFIYSLFGNELKLNKIIPAQALALIYVVLVGLNPPAIRAWIMSTFVIVGRLYGRKGAGTRLLLISLLVMTIADPLLLFSLSFQLSFTATLGLMLYSPLFESFFKSILGEKAILVSDLSTTMGAQVLVWPLISYVFGRISIISPVVNALVLWTVPPTTIMGFIFLALTYINGYLSSLFSYVVMLPLYFFIKVVAFFANFSRASLDIRIGLPFFISYYVFFICFHIFSRIGSRSDPDRALDSKRALT